MKLRDWMFTLLVLIAAGALGMYVISRPVMETGSWGLSFQQPGQAPVGNATAASLKNYDAAFLGDTREKVLYLTFDAGYENGYTEKILDVLKAQQVPAAFFLVGSYVEQNQDLVRRMVQEGHTVGNHTMHHYDMSKISDQEVFSKELSDMEELFQQATGKALPKFYRPPQGIYSEENLTNAQNLGYKTVFWSLAYVDWKNDQQPDPQQAVEKLLGRTHNGAVVLLHSTSKTNSEILDRLITRWKLQGYRFAPISELFSEETTAGT